MAAVVPFAAYTCCCFGVYRIAGLLFSGLQDEDILTMKIGLAPRVLEFPNQQNILLGLDKIAV